MIKKYLLLLSFNLLFMTTFAFGSELTGVIEYIHGDATVSNSDGVKALTVKSEIFNGDKIITAKDAELLLRMTDGATLAVRPNTDFTVTDYHFNQNDSGSDNMVVKLLKGGFRAVTGALGKANPHKVKFNTPSATIGIRGTDFELAVLESDVNGAESGTYNKVFHGATYIVENNNEIENFKGQRVDVGPNQVAFAPAKAHGSSHKFGIMKQVPNVFFNGKYDALEKVNSSKNDGKDNSEKKEEEKSGNKDKDKADDVSMDNKSSDSKSESNEKSKVDAKVESKSTAKSASKSELSSRSDRSNSNDASGSRIKESGSRDSINRSSGGGSSSGSGGLGRGDRGKNK